jgi:hypothetical protein
MMKKYPALIAFATVMCVTAYGALTPRILDQESDDLEAMFNVDVGSFKWEQEVTVGLAGPLVQVDLSVRLPGTAVILIYAGSPWRSGMYDFATVLTATDPGWVSIDTSSADLYFDVGDTFVISALGSGGGLWLGGGRVDRPGGSYERGELWFNKEFHSDGSWDIAFRTYVPEPGTVMIFGLGAVVVVSKKRRKG